MMRLLVELGYLLAGLGAVAFIVWAIATLTPYDSTDPPGGRSGMSIYIDHTTGCEYLSRRGLTPRLDGQGRHMGCKR